MNRYLLRADYFHDFVDSVLYDNIEKIVFNNLTFRIDEEQIREYFSGRTKAINDFKQFNPHIEKIYYDLSRGCVRALIISFYKLNDKQKYYYASIIYNYSYHTYEITYVTNDIRKISTSKFDEYCINDEVSQKIITYVLNSNLGIKELSSLSSSPYILFNESLYLADASSVDNEFKDLVCLILKDKLDIADGSKIKLVTLTIDINELDNPSIAEIQFENKGMKYVWCPYSDVINQISNCDEGDDLSSFLDVLIDIAVADFINSHKHILIEIQNKEIQAKIDEDKKKALKVISSLFHNFHLIEFEDSSYGFEELGHYTFMTFDESGVKIKLSRLNSSNDTIGFTYNEIPNNKDKIKKIIDKYIASKSAEYLAFIKSVDEFLNNTYDIKTSLTKGEELKLIAASLPSYDKERKEFKEKYNLFNEKYLKLSTYDKKKVSHVLEVLNKIKDTDSYFKYCEQLFDDIDNLGEGELAVIKDEFDVFSERFKSLSGFTYNQTIRRRVFIRKKVLDDIKEIASERTDLKNFISAIDEIVKCLKTKPGNELVKYLLSKGLNFPIKEDRSIKKIRILKNERYRLLFVYGSDINNDNDRLYNQDSIYIFAITQHKADKSDLYIKAKEKPTKYAINDFIIYPTNKMVKIPECTSKQYDLIRTIKGNEPVVTFGCAGSGKTTVSVEQYVDIVYNKFNSISPNEEELVYITFHKGLAEKVRKDLLEFAITGNCFKLDEYFAYVMNEAYDFHKAINEKIFIDWFNQNYSEVEIKKNKNNKKKKIAPLLDKPDIARLIYTYYRGIFKGSKKLLNSKLNYLSINEFLDEMNDEEYLKDDEKEAIYNLCLEFDNYAHKNGLLSDNDYAINVIRQSNLIKKTNCIIIDEIQDLTEIEIIAVIKTLKEESKRIYFYGDPHQSINPNVFNNSTINKVFTELMEVVPSNNAQLGITYRTNIFLIKYLNELLKYRKDWIGSLSGGLLEISEPEIVSQESSWAGYVTNKKLYKDIFKSNPNSMIITPSDSVKENLLKKYPDIDEERVISIYEAKGMEWETIIMYNMFSDYQVYFKDMISNNGKAKKSTIHRMTFNKYYVGCTRSTKSFVIIEEDENIFDENNIIFKTLLSSFAPIYKSEQISTYILENNTFEAWYKEALQNLNNENDAAFKHAYLHAQRIAEYGNNIEQLKQLKELLSGTPDFLENIGLKCLNEGEYNLARSAFIKCNKQTGKHGTYILLATILSGKNLNEDDLKRFIKNNEIIDKYPQVLPALMKQKAFKMILSKIQNRLMDKEK